MCSNENYIKQEDFRCIGVVANRCDNEKLCEAIYSTENLTVFNYLCDADYFKIKELIHGDSLLECGGVYECDGKKRNLAGFKVFLCNLIYSEYIMINTLRDTPVGVRIHGNEESIAPTGKELLAYSNIYVSRVEMAVNSLKDYLCCKYTDYEWGFECKSQSGVCGDDFSGNCSSTDLGIEITNIG